MRLPKMTTLQQVQLHNLKTHKSLFVGYSCPALMRTFNKLVERGDAKVTQEIKGLGKWFTAINPY